MCIRDRLVYQKQYGMLMTFDNTWFSKVVYRPILNKQGETILNIPIILLSMPFEVTKSYPFKGMKCDCGQGKACQVNWDEAQMMNIWEIFVRYFICTANDSTLPNDDILNEFYNKKGGKGYGKNNEDESNKDGDNNNNDDGSDGDSNNEEAGLNSANSSSGVDNKNNSNFSKGLHGIVFERPLWSELNESDNLNFIGESRTGPIYRIPLQGYDCIFKMLYLLVKRYELDGMKDVYPTKIIDELDREVNVYNKLKAYQGDIIPKLLWRGRMAGGAVDALVTEYAGDELPEKLNKTQAMNVRYALGKIHEAGVIHGDIELRNFLLKKDTKDEIVVVDFAFSKFRDDVDNENEWNDKIAEECEELEILLNYCTIEEEVEEIKESTEVDERNEMEECKDILQLVVDDDDPMNEMKTKRSRKRPLEESFSLDNTV